MLSWYNRNITQTEICLHNTLHLNRIFTGEIKKKKRQKTAITCSAWIEFFAVLCKCREMLSWLCLAEHFFKGLQSKGPRSLRHAPTLEGDAEGTVTGGAGVRDQRAMLRGLVLPGQLPGLGQGAGTRGWEKLALATFNSGHQSLTAP